MRFTCWDGYLADLLNWLFYRCLAHLLDGLLPLVAGGLPFESHLGLLLGGAVPIPLRALGVDKHLVSDEHFV